MVLWGRRITLDTTTAASCCGQGAPDGYGGRECCGGPEPVEVDTVIYADTGEPFDPAAYGWEVPRG